jgi:predicted ATP-grasp superfamily ATP-dependent carboligase
MSVSAITKAAQAFISNLARLADLENSLDQLREEAGDWQDNLQQLSDELKVLRREVEAHLKCLGHS